MTKTKKQQDDEANEQQVIRDEATAEKTYQRTLGERDPEFAPVGSEDLGREDRVEAVSTGKGVKAAAPSVPGSETLAEVLARQDAAAAAKAEALATQTPTEAWLAEAQEAQAVWARGEVVSPDRLKALISAAIGVLTPTAEP